MLRTLSRTLSRKNEPEQYYDEKDGKVSKADDWRMMPAVKEYKAHDPASGRRLGVTWNNLTVKGISADAALQENAFSQFNIPKLIKEGRRAASLKTIVDSSSGSVQPGEMLLVLGRPGAGCTTLLKMLANRRGGSVHSSIPTLSPIETDKTHVDTKKLLER